MNSGLENGAFECPRGFSKEDVASQLYLEDLDEDSELWLVRMPSNVDPSSLENQQVDLSSELNRISNGDNNYECISERCQMPNLSLVLPQKESRRLTRVKKTFQGSILLYDTVVEEDDLQIKIEEDIENVLEEVNDQPDDRENVLEEKIEADDNFVMPKSKKHKHSKEHKAAHSESDIYSKTEDNEIGTIKKKKHKKKKSSVKMEPSSDGDEFPNCISQQN